MRRGLILIVALMIAAPFTAVSQGQSSSSASDSKMASSDFKRLLTLANSGSTQAEFRLGLAYQYGHGVEQSAYEAARWYRMAANSGDSAAQNNLGFLYATGPDGVVRDLAEAARWYLRAAVEGNPMAQFNLGHLYLYTASMKKAPEEGLYWIQRAASAGCLSAFTLLGSLYARGEFLPQDSRQAFKMTMIAAKKHEPVAEANLG